MSQTAYRDEEAEVEGVGGARKVSSLKATLSWSSVRKEQEVGLFWILESS